MNYKRLIGRAAPVVIAACSLAVLVPAPPASAIAPFGPRDGCLYTNPYQGICPLAALPGVPG